jgi:hypothetical protein
MKAYVHLNRHNTTSVNVWMAIMERIARGRILAKMHRVVPMVPSVKLILKIWATIIVLAKVIFKASIAISVSHNSPENIVIDALKDLPGRIVMF